MLYRVPSWLVAAIVPLLLTSSTTIAYPARHNDYDDHWVDTWVSMPQLTEYTNLPPPPFNRTDLVFYNSTIRQTIHTTIGGSQIRVRISNVFSPVDLPITAVTVALPANGSAGVSAIQPETFQTLTFSGSPSINIPDGALAVSDPINFVLQPASELTITMYLASGQQSNYITSHPGSRTTSYFSFGNYVNATNMTDPSTQSVAHWYFISAVEAWVPKAYTALSIIGDSITDGRGSTTNANNRWPDLLFARMLKDSSPDHIAINDQAAGGNRILADGLGPSVLSRLDRDVLAHPSVSYAMIFEGVNDIGVAPNNTAAQEAIYLTLIQAYRQIITRVHEFGIPIFGATITPFSAPNSTIQPYSDAIREEARQRVNDWIRRSGYFDAVVDFDAVVRDPSNASQLSPEYNSGDFLHPNVAGYEAMAAAFPLGLFDQFRGGVLGFV